MKFIVFIVLALLVSCTPVSVTPTPIGTVTAIPPTYAPTGIPNDDIIRVYHPDTRFYSNNIMFNVCSAKTTIITLRAYEMLIKQDEDAFHRCLASKELNWEDF
jgi:hypothetical protein